MASLLPACPLLRACPLVLVCPLLPASTLCSHTLLPRSAPTLQAGPKDVNKTDYASGDKLWAAGYRLDGLATDANRGDKWAKLSLLQKLAFLTAHSEKLAEVPTRSPCLYCMFA
jgi:hypothetical protein